jgi:predicted RNA-binding protein Jag
MAIFTGETVEDAIDRGLNRLGVKRENVHIHIEQKEKKVSWDLERNGLGLISSQSMRKRCVKLII